MEQSIGYAALLRRNPTFRRLWLGQVVSQLGDWFDLIALYALILRLTNSGEAVGLILVAQSVPPAIIGVWAGVIIDRLPRKAVLIASDIGRGLLVLGFLFINDPSLVWVIYLLTALKFSLTAFFEPARSALLPLVTRPDELVAANGLSGVTWAVMLAVGAALGGGVAGVLGADVAFVIDAASFFISAVLIAGVRVTEPSPTEAGPSRPLTELREGLKFVVSQPDMAIYTFTKAMWGLGAGGIAVLLPLFGQKVFPLGVDGAISIGLLYAARGLGAAIGPILAQRYGGGSVQFLRRTLSVGFLITAIGYFALGRSPSLLIACCMIIMAHIGGNTAWVFSSVLLQLSVPDRFRGRVFSVELAALTVTAALASYAIGVLSDTGLAPQILAGLVAGSLIVPGALVTLWLWREPTGAAEDDLVKSEA